jgi:ATP-dependent DNA helicase RecG
MATDSPHKATGSPHKATDSPHTSPESPHTVEQDSDGWKELLNTATPARGSQRLPTTTSRGIIRALCEGRYLTATQLGALMDREANQLRERFLTPMVREGMLVQRYPDEPNRPDQAYTTSRPAGSEHGELP